MATGSDKAHSGLPTAEDYDPDALGTVDFRAGDPVQEWPEFGLEMVPIEMKSKNVTEWEDTTRRMISRNGQFIADVSADYKLLPNERTVSAANEVARELGAEPFHEFDGDWYVNLDDHVYQDEERRRVHALYAWDTRDWGDETLEYGFGVHNSIDGSLGFSVGLFSFRHACANMVHLGVDNWRAQAALGVESEREILAQSTSHHTSGLDINKEALKARIKGVLMLVDDVDEAYRQWRDEIVTPEQIIDLIGLFPEKDLPGWMVDLADTIETWEEHQDVLAAQEEAAEADDTGGFVFGDDRDDAAADDGEDAEAIPEVARAYNSTAEVVEAQMPDVDVWTTYNDLTEAIWHRGSSQDTTRRRKMKKLHRVFQPTEGVQ